MRTFSLGPLLLLLSLSGASAAAADTWHVAWTRQLPERQPMWAHNSRRYPMDGVATVVDAGDLLLVGCTADGTVRAYRRADGGEAWRFAFDGAVRWTPTVAGDAVFVGSDDSQVEFDQTPEAVSQENAKLKKLLNMSVNEIELSVRAANCLNNANITTVGQLGMKSEAEMLKYRNFGKKSLNEIKDKLEELGLGLGMKFDAGLIEPAAEVEPEEDEEKKSKKK